MREQVLLQRFAACEELGIVLQSNHQLLDALVEHDAQFVVRIVVDGLQERPEPVGEAIEQTILDGARQPPR